VGKCFKGIAQEANFAADLPQTDALGFFACTGGCILSCLLGAHFHLDDGGNMSPETFVSQNRSSPHVHIVAAASHLEKYLER
jgi:hypothetical protein